MSGLTFSFILISSQVLATAESLDAKSPLVLTLPAIALSTIKSENHFGNKKSAKK